LTARNLLSGARFRRDVKLAQRRAKDMSKLRELILLLAEGKALPPGVVKAIES
jgi:mRNA-degrading endonuclease YafQ of YafQ-DinJ toxin-antitoxin module